MISNRKGIELSVNFLVSVILAIVLFGMGVIFARNLFTGGSEIAETSQEALQAAIESMYCNNNEIVCVNLNAKTLQRGKDQVFGVAVRNIYDPTNFRIFVSPTKYLAKDDTAELWDASMHPITVFPADHEFTLEKNREERFGFLVRPEANTPKGKYILDVRVERDDEGQWVDYDVVHKIYVTVV